MCGNKENERLYNLGVMLYGQSNEGENIELLRQAKDALEQIEDGYRSESANSLLARINRILENRQS